MAHQSTNPTWTNSATTPINAAALENYEAAIDRLAVVNYGATGRTMPYRCIVTYGADYAQPAGDVFAGTPGNWAAFYDPDSMFLGTSSGGGASALARLLIPATGFWDIDLHVLGTTNGTTGALNAYIAVGSGATTPTTGANSVAMDSKPNVATGSNISINPRFLGALTAGQFVYWATYASGASQFTMHGTGVVGGRTQIVASWRGPSS